MSKKLQENKSEIRKYKEGEFGYWWTVIHKNPDIEGLEYKEDIYCMNSNLTSLRGCPKIVRGSFFACNNKLTSLKGCPDIITMQFSCSENKLTSLDYCPSYIGSKFWCYNNNIKEIPDDFSFIDNFMTNDNYFYKNKFVFLDGAIQIVIGNKNLIKQKYEIGTFGYWWTVIRGNQDIEDLVYYGNIDCSNNQIISFKGCPAIIKGSFLFYNNPVVSPQYFPSKIYRHIACSNNYVRFIPKNYELLEIDTRYLDILLFEKK